MKGIMKLDDDMLDRVAGGVAELSGQAPRIVALNQLDTNQLQRYLMGLCPYCANPLTGKGKAFGCIPCNIELKP